MPPGAAKSGSRAETTTGSTSSRFVATPSCPWPLLSKQAIEKASPSRREGMSYKEEISYSRSVCNLMIKTGAPGPQNP